MPNKKRYYTQIDYKLTNLYREKIIEIECLVYC